MPEYGNPWPVPVTHNGEGMNMAQWVGTYEDWAEKMMMMGYKVDDLTGIAAQSGEIFPKNLVSSIKAKNTLFPGADMGYTYDLAGGQKQRPVSYSDPSLGMMDWQAMDPSELAAASQYNSWANNPSNAGYESTFGDNNYNAWLAASRGQSARPANAQGPTNGLMGTLPQGAPGHAPLPAGAQSLADILGQKPETTGVTSQSDPNTVDPYAATSTLGGLMGTDDWKKKLAMQGGTGAV